MKVHTSAVRSVCFSSDDSLLLTASDDKTIKLWCAVDQKFRSSLTGHTNWVQSAVFCKHAELVASGGMDKTVRIWDVEKKAVIVSFHDFNAPVAKVRFHPDGSCVAACGGDGCVRLWDLRSRRLSQHYDAHVGPVLGISFSPGGDRLASSSEDEALKLWDLREGRLLHRVSNHVKATPALAFAPSGCGLVSGGTDNNVYVWDFTGNGFGSASGSVSSAGLAAGFNTPSSPRHRRSSSLARSLRSPNPATATCQSAHHPSAPSRPLSVGQRPKKSGCLAASAFHRGSNDLAAPSRQQSNPGLPGTACQTPATLKVSQMATRGSQIHASKGDPEMSSLHSPMARSPVVQGHLECGGMAASSSPLAGGTSADLLPAPPLSGLPLSGRSPAAPYSEARSHPCTRSPQASEQAATWEAYSGLPSTAVRELQVQDLPAPLAQTLQSMQGQLELMARTAQLLDQRLSATERLVADVRRELLRSPVAAAAQHPSDGSEDDSAPAAWARAPGGGQVPEIGTAAGSTGPVPLLPSSLPATLLC